MSRVLLGERRPSVPLESLQANIDSDYLANALAGIFPESMVSGFLNPPDDVAEFLYGLSCTAEGLSLIEYIMDLSLRAPVRVTGATLEQTALNAARREGINFLAEAILAGIVKGKKSIEARKSPGKIQ